MIDFLKHSHLIPILLHFFKRDFTSSCLLEESTCATCLKKHGMQMCERSLILNGRCSPTGRVICCMPSEIILFFNFPISFRNGCMQKIAKLQRFERHPAQTFNPSCHTACASVCTEAANSWRRAARPGLDAWQGWWGKGLPPFTVAMGWLRLERSKLLCATSCAASMGSLHWHPLLTKVKASNIQHYDLDQSWQ